MSGFISVSKVGIASDIQCTFIGLTPSSGVRFGASPGAFVMCLEAVGGMVNAIIGWDFLYF